jgi:hypothetical protein
VHRLAVEVVDDGVGSKFCAALLSPPVLDGADERSSNAFPPMVGRDIYAFEEGDGRGCAAFNVVAAQICFGEADGLARIGNAIRLTVSPGSSRSAAISATNSSRRSPGHRARRSLSHASASAGDASAILTGSPK